jgi:DNA-binding beta-propeller fold protein YncE
MKIKRAGWLLFMASPFLILLAGCPSKNNPSSPAAPGPTATPSAPSESVSFAPASFSPFGIRTAKNGNLWILQNNTGSLEQVTTAGVLVGSAITTFNAGATFKYPQVLAVDSGTGDVYVGDSQHARVEVFDSTGTYLTTFGTTELAGYYDEGIAINSAGTTVYVETDQYYTYLVYSVTAGTPPTYTYQSTSVGAGVPGGLNYPAGACFDSQGNLWVADFTNGRVVEYNAAGTYQTAVTLKSSGIPEDVAVDHSGNIFAADTHNHVIQEFNAAGQWLYNTTGSISNPTGLSLDSTGNYLYVADLGNNQVEVFKIH